MPAWIPNHDESPPEKTGAATRAAGRFCGTLRNQEAIFRQRGEETSPTDEVYVARAEQCRGGRRARDKMEKEGKPTTYMSPACIAVGYVMFIAINLISMTGKFGPR